MIVRHDILNRIIKNKLIKKSENNMYNYALLDREELIKNFEEDIKLSDICSIQKELDKICDPNNLFSFGEFENKQKEILENQISKLKENNEINDDLEEIKISKNYVPNEIIDKYKILLSDLKKQIKAFRFKIFYYEIEKRQKISNKNITKAVKIGDELTSLKNKLEEIINKYNDNIQKLNNVQLENINKYLCMLSDFLKEKNPPKEISQLKNKYSDFIVDCFLVDKLRYLILSKLDMVPKDNLVNAIKTDDYLKDNYKSIFDKLLRRFDNVGTDC